MSDLFYNKTATIWNKETDGVWETETWHPCVIRNVRILDSRGTNIQKSGNAQADRVRLHISDAISEPELPYAKPEEWVPEETYTLDDKTFFSEGDTSDETPDKAFFERSDVFHVSSVDRFDLIPHFEAWGR